MMEKDRAKKIYKTMNDIRNFEGRRRIRCLLKISCAVLFICIQGKKPSPRRCAPRMTDEDYIASTTEATAIVSQRVRSLTRRWPS